MPSHTFNFQMFQGSGTAIKVDVSATTEVKPLNCVIVKNIDPCMTKLDVASHFQTAGDIKSVSVSFSCTFRESADAGVMLLFFV